MADIDLKILFFLGFANPFPGAGWTGIGFFAKNTFRKISITSLIFNLKVWWIQR